ncbi:MAG: hypothetical protein ABWZ42_08505 [Ilumatobacteraceae bacterium]
MIVRPMIGEWEIPRIERIQTLESRRLARLSVPGLRGDLHQDLGQHSLVIEISGSLHSDEERDAFLDSVRNPFNAGDPVAFVADITTATELEEVLIEHLDLAEHNDHADSFRYTVRLRQYVEPPEPPSPIDELGADLGAELDALAALGDLALDLPNMLGDIPSVGDPTPPLREALTSVETAVAPLSDLLAELGTVFG